jgi:cytochrome c-type biogenesis protein CcmI
MTSFWLALVAMTLVATFFVLVPVVRFKQVHSKSGLASDWFLARRVELEKELDEGKFTQEEFNEALLELKVTAKDELTDALAENSIHDKSNAINYLIVAAVLLVVVSAGFYAKQGEYDKLEDWQATLLKMPELSQTVLQNLDKQVSTEELQDFALGLRTKLVEKDEPIGWMLLGRTLLAIGDVDGAIQAFEKSYKG